MLEKVSKLSSRDKLLIFILVAVSFILISIRFLWIDRFPVGITHDDSEVLLSAWTYISHGTDSSGTSFPMSIFSNNTAGGLAGLPSAILAPIVGNFSFSLFVARLPYVFLNIATIIILALFVYRLLKDKRLAIIVFLVGLVNPWLFVYSRYPTEAPFSLFFIILGMYMLFSLKGKMLIFSALPFAAGFFSYFGAKPVIPLLVIALVIIHAKFWHKESLKIYLSLLGVFALSVAIYLVYFLNASSGSTFTRRASNETVFSNFEKYSMQADEQRRGSIDYPFKNLIYNKYTNFVKDELEKVTGVFSPQFLFLGGDELSVYRLGEHGVIYFIDGIFIILGIVYIQKLDKNKKGLIVSLLVSGVVIALVPSAISRVGGTSYFFRSFFLIPWLIILISMGINFLIQGSAKRKTISAVLIATIYLVFFISFLTFFFFRYSVREQENHFLSERILANYISRVDKITDKSIVVGTVSPHDTYLEFLLYSNYLDKDTILFAPSENPHIGKISFISKCEPATIDKIVILDSRLNCDKLGNQNPSGIYNQKDAGEQFLIYNDILCNSQNLDQWRRHHLIDDYLIESMSIEEFCNRWIQKL